VNDNVCKAFGYSREELLNMSIPDIDVNFTFKIWPNHWKELKEKTSFTFESLHRRKDGTTFPVEVTVNYMEFENEEYNCAFARDITERKKQEEALVQRTQQLEILSRTSQHINAVLEVPVIMRTLVAAAMEAVNATGGSGGLLVNGKMEFSEYNRDGKIEHINYSFGPGQGVPGWISVNMKPYISNDAQKDPQIFSEKLKRFGLYNLVSVPIINHKAELLGCFEIFNKEGRTPFDAQDVFIMQGLAASAAIALENAKLIAERKRDEDMLRQSENRYRAIVEDQTELICRYRLDGVITFVNEAYCRCFGRSREQLLDKSFMPFVLKEDMEIVKENFAKLDMRHPFFTHEHRVVAVNGQIRWHQWSNRAIFDDKGNITEVQGVGRDITDRKEAEEKLQKLYKQLMQSHKKLEQIALKDPHTGLYNYRYLNEFIEPELFRAIRCIHPLSVIMMDIDYFKSVNDVYGHEFGDLVLKQFSAYLKKIVRRYDIVIRSGGEEFIIIAPGVNRLKAYALAQRILDAVIVYSFGNKQHTVKLKLSIAVASYPDDKITRGVDLINLADKILNKVKAEGGNRVYSSEELSAKKKKIKDQKEPTDVKLLREKIDKLTKRGKQGLIESIFAFAKTIELRDRYTGEHVENTVRYATEIAQAMELNAEDIENIKEAAILHDLGKIGISDKILLKKSKLTNEEFDEIKRHPQIAADIIRPIQFMHDIIPLILYHHERWDGKGYPADLKGDEIPIGARIIAIADVYQALTSDRPYRKAFSKKKALDIIKQGSGTQFDPSIVKVFLKILEKEK